MYATLLLLGLGALTAGIQAQTNASIALPGFDTESLPISGEIVGTGADGTTYVISASGTDAGDIPFTMTVVQDATHVSEALTLATGIGGNIQCGYNTQGVGTCTIVVAGAGTGTETDAAPSTLITTGTIPMVAVPVTTAPPPTTSASGSGSPNSANALNVLSAAKMGLVAVFPAILVAFLNI
ncbi:uncharacterized protein FOMMEDRAFT_17634 [Fomitiporia mediterranea MF3/22]|uniref:uncharacterized protein n=1 Tax=Fomitiporia mediterranea (strain MF3/22) TaxID=694068 RepID=UPI0004409163|nr:uncharacterized protein FOMMEDRAFT_17634 [Fomitiporia mediterranea MF3/22]EJD07170.1 hypothetical protein FOMMEDRAFT_17634 [Fomitiporia mediterranea MF3/22]